MGYNHEALGLGVQFVRGEGYGNVGNDRWRVRNVGWGEGCMR